MPVIKGKYAANETQIYQYLRGTMGLSLASAVAVLTNIYKESSFNPGVHGDEGTSFGICQWHKGRYENLRNYCSSIGKDYKTVAGQLSYLQYELERGYSKVLTKLKENPNTIDGCWDSAAYFCARFEVPKGWGSFNDQKVLTYGPTSIYRGDLAKSTFWPYYAQNDTGTSIGDVGGGIIGGGTSVDGGTIGDNSVSYNNLGQQVAQLAMAQVGKPYVLNTSGPDTFDCIGLVKWCYRKIGVDVGGGSVGSVYNYIKGKARYISTNAASAGDIIFYETQDGDEGPDHVAIAMGDGTRVHAKGTRYGVVHDPNLSAKSGKDIKYILRVLQDSETSQGTIANTVFDSTSGYGSSAISSTSLTAVDPYSEIIATNLSKVEAVGYDYGYLYVLDGDDSIKSRAFKFYIPEFTETAGANWRSVELIGRSVKVLAYTDTDSRKITINLDLFAGAGLYGSSSEGDVVTKLHDDVNFIKSLEYPDYTDPILSPPATVQLILGSSINLVGVVSGVSVEHLKPLDSQNRSMYIKLAFTVTQTAVNPPSCEEIRGAQSEMTSTSSVDSIGANNSSTIMNNQNSARGGGNTIDVEQ